jgi:hypothetical protein
VIVRSIAGNVEAQGYAFVGYAQIISSEIYNALGVPFAVGASVALLSGVVIFLIKTVISYIAFQFTVFTPGSSFIIRRRRRRAAKKTNDSNRNSLSQEENKPQENKPQEDKPQKQKNENQVNSEL